MQPQNQTLLTAIIAVVISLAFVGVAAAEYYHNIERDVVELYTTDSNQEFYNNTQDDGTWDYFTTMLRYRVTSTYYAEPQVPVYMGNDTWAVSMPGNPEGSLSASHIIAMNLPDIDNFFIKYVNLSMIVGSMPDDTYLAMSLGSFGQGEIIENVNIEDAAGYLNLTWSLSTFEALSLMTYASNNDTGEYMNLNIKAASGEELPTQAWSFSITFYGEEVTTWSLQDSVNVVLGASIAFNIVVGLYMTDGIDFGGVQRKDLRQTSSRRSDKWRR